ncbi:Nepenthesin [Bertholletia excelsa]
MGTERVVLLVAATVLLVFCSNLTWANLVLKVEHRFAGLEKTHLNLGAFKDHDNRRHGRRLSAVRLPLSGDGLAFGTALFYTTLGIGTPAKDYYLQVDTGSDVTWVNCAGCKGCPAKSDLGVKLRLYDVKSSKSGSVVACDQEFCADNIKPPSCKSGSSCPYSVQYADKSTTEGYIVKDIVQLDKASGDYQTTPMNGSVAFGCGDRQSGRLSSSKDAVDGILGFGQSDSSMISQLSSAGEVKKIFAHCLDSKKRGGIFAIGEVVQPAVNTTPMIKDQTFYIANLSAIEVGGDLLQVNSGGAGGNTDLQKPMLIDSGTTLAYLTEELFTPLVKKILAAQPGLVPVNTQQQFICFQFSGKVDDGFHDVTLHFGSQVSITVPPHEYLLDVGEDVWCVGWQGIEGTELSILGDLVLSNKLVVYNLENQTIGMANYDCSSTIKVKDEETGAEYVISSSKQNSSGRALALLTSLIMMLIMFA